MIDAAEAIQHPHEAKIVHRDLKPSNLMVDKSGHCWVIDFGLFGYLKAQVDSQMRTNGEAEAGSRPRGPTPALDLGPEPPPVSGVLGTPPYMAPEQFHSQADAETDVWGLGVILYELLTLPPGVSRQEGS